MSLFRQPRRKTTDKEIAAILAATGSQHEIARALGLSQATVWRVKNNLDTKRQPIRHDAEVGA